MSLKDSIKYKVHREDSNKLWHIHTVRSESFVPPEETLKL